MPQLGGALVIGSQLLLPFAYALLIYAAAHTALRRYWGRRARSQRDCHKRLRELGFGSLKQYRNSKLWRDKREAYRKSDYPQRCLICRARRVDLHHRTYARLGAEELFDLVPLCRRHHDELHELLDSHAELCIQDTHDYLAVLKERGSPRQPRPRDAPRRSRSRGSRKHRGRRGTSLSVPQKISRVGMTWTEEEDAALLEGFREGTPIDELAERLHRGVKSVEVRLVKLGQLAL